MTLTPKESFRPDPAKLRIVEVPLRIATEESLRGFGRIVRDYASAEVQIATWPAQGQRPVDPGTGRGGGFTEGPFAMQWHGDALHAQNHAVGGDYVTGWSADSERLRLLTHEANYHPDGGQIFYPRAGAAFVALLARPGDEVRPEDFVALYCDGSFGIHVDAGVWHQPVFPLADTAVFDDKQSAVHACVSVDFVREFGCVLSVPLRAAAAREVPSGAGRG